MSAQAAATDGCESRSQPETAGDSERTRTRIVYDAKGTGPDPATGEKCVRWVARIAVMESEQARREREEQSERGVAKLAETEPETRTR